MIKNFLSDTLQYRERLGKNKQSDKKEQTTIVDNMRDIGNASFIGFVFICFKQLFL